MRSVLFSWNEYFQLLKLNHTDICCQNIDMENNPSSSRVERKIIERNRRNQMKALFRELNSLVPHQSSKVFPSFTLHTFSQLLIYFIQVKLYTCICSKSKSSDILTLNITNTSPKPLNSLYISFYFCCTISSILSITYISLIFLSLRSHGVYILRCPNIIFFM